MPVSSVLREHGPTAGGCAIGEEEEVRGDSRHLPCFRLSGYQHPLADFAWRSDWTASYDRVDTRCAMLAHLCHAGVA